MRLQYKNDPLDFQNQYEMINGHTYNQQRNAYYLYLAGPTAIGALGVFGSFPHSLGTCCLIIASVAFYLMYSLPFSRYYQRHIEAACRGTPTKQIALEIKPDGFLEISDGIESFCPWSSMVGYEMFRDTLFVEVAPQMWAIIPSRSLSSDSPKLEEVTGVLKKNGVAEQSPEEAQRL